MVLNVHRNHGAFHRGGGTEVGERGRLCTYRCTVNHQNDSCIKMGSDESHGNVSFVICVGLSHKQYPQQTTTFLKIEKGEPK